MTEGLLMKQYIKKIVRLIRECVRRLYNKIIAKRLKNKDFSLIASNCNGAVLLHDLGLKYNSPFVDLRMIPDEFIRFLSDIHHYLSCELIFIEEPDISYPIGLLDDVRLYFQHYPTKELAKEKWEERVQRINFDNLFVMFTDRDGCTYENLCEFEALPYKNKVVFTHKPYPEFPSACYIRGWESNGAVGVCFEYRSLYSIKKYYDDFDYIRWFNNGR